MSYYLLGTIIIIIVMSAARNVFANMQCQKMVFHRFTTVRLPTTKGFYSSSFQSRHIIIIIIIIIIM